MKTSPTVSSLAAMLAILAALTLAACQSTRRDMSSAAPDNRPYNPQAEKFQSPTATPNSTGNMR